MLGKDLVIKEHAVPQGQMHFIDRDGRNLIRHVDGTYKFEDNKIFDNPPEGMEAITNLVRRFEELKHDHEHTKEDLNTATKYISKINKLSYEATQI